MHSKRFQEHWLLGRPKFQFAMVRQNNVLQSVPQLRRKVGHQPCLFADHFNAQVDMANQLAAGRVGKSAVEVEFFEFTKIVQQETRQNQIAVEEWVVVADLSPSWISELTCSMS